MRVVVRVVVRMVVRVVWVMRLVRVVRVVRGDIHGATAISCKSIKRQYHLCSG